MSKTRIALGLLLLAGALMSLGACDWFYGLFGDPPTAVLVADPTAGTAPLPVTFDLSGSTAPGGVRQIRVDFGDGSDFATGTDLDEAIDHTYTAPGTYTAVLELTDDIGRTDHDTEEIAVADGPESGDAGPIALLGADTTLGDAPLVVFFDVSLSSSPDSALVSFRLDFGDGTTPYVGTNFSQPIAHLYVPVGLHTATLRVSDVNGQTATATLDVVATAQAAGDAPTAILTADPTFGDVPLAVSFDVSDSSSPEGSLVRFRLDFGDGTTPHDTTDFSLPITHLYVGVGVHTATLTVTDADGATGTATLGIVATAEGDDPIASFDWSPEDALLDGVVTFDAGASTDPSRRAVDPQAIVVYTWDFGDSAEAAVTGETVDHTYTWPGTYTVTLTVYDDDGVAGTSSEQITVRGAIAYVSSLYDGSVSQIRLPANTVSHTTKVADRATGVAIDPDGSFVYVGGVSLPASLSSKSDVPPVDGVVKKIRTSDHTVEDELTLDRPVIDVACDPDGRWIYATVGRSGPGFDSVYVIDAATMTLHTTVTVNYEPTAIAFSPNGASAYAASQEAPTPIAVEYVGAVTVIDTTTSTIETSIPNDFGRPEGIAISSDGQFAYVLLPGHGIRPYDLTSSPPSAGADYWTHMGLSAIALTHDDAFAYVADPASHSVYAIPVAGLSLGGLSGTTIPLSARARRWPPATDATITPAALYVSRFWDIAISPGDTVAIVPHGVQPVDWATWSIVSVPIMDVSIIDTATQVVTDVPVGSGPLFVDVWGIGY